MSSNLITATEVARRYGTSREIISRMTGVLLPRPVPLAYGDDSIRFLFHPAEVERCMAEPSRRAQFALAREFDRKRMLAESEG